MFFSASQAIFALICWQLARFWGDWREGCSSVFYVIHAPLHEVGHAVARMLHLPETLVVLAGTVFQLLTPIAIGAYFVWHDDCPALSLCTGWLGFATLETATYMHDAPFGNLTLVAPFASGPELIHDFTFLFTHWHCLRHAARIAEITATIGYAFVYASLAMIVAMLILGWTRPEADNNE